jgi:hypothetical protein
VWEEATAEGTAYPYRFRLKTTAFTDKGLGNPEDFLDEILWWCRNQYDGMDFTRYRPLAYNIYFANSEDAFGFKMRWC